MDPLTSHPFAATSSDATAPLAVLWDFDGTLVNTEPLWIDSEVTTSRRYGGSWTHALGETQYGRDVADVGVYMVEHGYVPGVSDGAAVAREITDEVVRRILEADIAWLPGAVDTLADVAAADVPCALVSASPRRILDGVLERLDTHPFRVIVSGDDVTLNKPHAEPYLTAAAGLGVDPAACLAIEDSVPGTTSALAAGAVVLAVPTMVTIEAGPRTIVRTDGLLGMGWKDLAAIYAEGRS